MIELQSFQIFGVQFDKEHRPLLVSSMLPSHSPLVHIEFELFSVNKNSDYRLELIIEPIQIIYHAVS
jgi:hypothetical protein